LFVAVGFWVYKQSVGKFELRRLSLPTRIYADYTPLRPGLSMQRDDLLEKLDRLGYRQTTALVQSGDYIPAADGVDVFTRAFTHPSGTYQAQPVRVTIRDAAIASVSAAHEGKPVETAALEPELLTSILSDQLENRRPVVLDQIPQVLQDAVIVTEDIRFWHHPGVDPLGIFRAVFRNVKAGGVAEGGSTLTQQLVKNYYLTSERTMKRKVVEAFMAVILDAKYSKREILEAYLNDIYLGRNRSISIIGVGEASRFYFGKPVSEITPAQAALLAGMIRGPNNYAPFTHPDKAMPRRATVLGLMLHNKKIDQAAYDKAMAEPLPRKPFRERSGLSSIPFYVDRVMQEMARDYGIADVKGRGLQIYTALDLAAQDTATRSLEAGLQSLEKGNRRLRRGDPQKALQGVIIHVDVQTGEIRALVGGRNYDVNQFNRALNSKRLVGSLFKPFVFLTAFEPSLSQQNITPATLVSDTRFVLKRKFAEDWSPGNYEDAYHGTVTVREALEQSLNSASVRIGLACGLDPIIKTAHTLGVTEELEANPAIILGAVGIPPIQMADAYATLARSGSRVPLRTVRFVTDDRNKVVSAGDAVQPVQVFPARDVFLVTNMMKGVVDRGTAFGARRAGFKKIAAGKTGTTNDKRDAWFIGFTPQTLALTWVGFDDNSPIGISGGEGAVPIWTRYMLWATAGQPDTDFSMPAGIVFAAMDESSGGLGTPQCPPKLVVNQAFKDGTAPTAPCPIHSPQAAPPPSVDQFGNPIQLGAPPATSPEGLAPVVDTAPLPDSTLTGGVFRTDTTDTGRTDAPPPPVEPSTETTTPPPPPRERPREVPPQPQPGEPPPVTNTSAPPPSTNTSPP
ncbi:MAG: family penicillin-binding protein, partial [Acidobacteria bacterium]|nr:family penicillin-binding protein [Acidobacteriota bacterium]